MFGAKWPFAPTGFKISAVFSLIMLVACARIVAPGGGPDDIRPPEARKYEPENKTLNFGGEKVKITFDEFVVVKNFNQEFVSSPPLKQIPKMKLKGKTITLKWIEDTLKPNTSYTFNFGNSIADFRSGNQLRQFKYIFSTGNTIDSLSLRGQVYWAKNLEEAKAVWVLLYADSAGSPLSTRRPDYIAKTDEQGGFLLENLPQKDFYISALQDINKNLIFDLPNEALAFSDSPVRPYWRSMLSDTLADSLKKEVKRYDESKLDLFLFQETYINYYLSESTRPKSHLLQLLFSQASDSVPQISLKNAAKEDYLVEINATNDSAWVWLCDSSLIKKDTIVCLLNYFKTDSALHLKQTDEELSLIRQELIGEKKKELTANFLTLTRKAKGQQPFFEPVIIESAFPLKEINKRKIRVLKKKKETYVDLTYSLELDKNNAKQFILNKNLEEASNYRIEFQKEAVKDGLSRYNDTLKIDFKTDSENQYSNIKLKLNHVNARSIVLQVLADKNRLVRTYYIDKDSSIDINRLKVKEYTLRCFFDTNKNRKWDSGSYKDRQQPEKLVQYPQKIPTKANWTQEIIWDLEAN